MGAKWAKEKVVGYEVREVMGLYHTEALTVILSILAFILR